MTGPDRWGPSDRWNAGRAGAVARQNRRGHGSLRAHASIAWKSALDREILASDLVAEKLQVDSKVGSNLRTIVWEAVIGKARDRPGNGMPWIGRSDEAGPLRSLRDATDASELCDV